ncbi:MAG TPA: sugar kinase [Roseiflexaceae bacterium]|jgi:2-dehydro-3-deoxygluconokinase|nr:sugar kinase [Roseiflexaceae bacterium]
MRYDVVSFGETMLRLSPPPNIRLEESTTLNMFVAGTESNLLACLARLGRQCAWISVLPATAPGRKIAGELRRQGVDVSHVVWADATARVGTYYAEEAASPLGVQVQYDRAHSAVALIDPDAVDLTLIENAHLLHLTGITPALSDGARETWRRMLTHAQEHNVPISFDINYRAKLWSPQEAAAGIEEACRAATLLFCTREDAAEIWGFSGSAETILRQMARRFGADHPKQTLILTLGGEGSAQLHEGTFTHVPVFPSAGTSRFGSGDAFAAGYLHAYLSETQGTAAGNAFSAHPLTCGNAVAALKRCIPGDIALVTPEEVQTVLRGAAGRFR